MYSSQTKRRLFYFILKNASGLGNLKSVESSRPKIELVRLAPDLLVVGGGPAGLAAASESAKGSREVILVDSFPWLGGSLLATKRNRGVEAIHLRPSRTDELITSVSQARNIRVLLDTTIAGYYRTENVFLGVSDGTTFEIKPKAVILATGSHEVLPIFSGNDSPRVMHSFSALRLLDSGAKLGRNAILLALEQGDALLVSKRLKSRDVDVELISSPRTFDEQFRLQAQKMGVPLVSNSFIASVEGDQVEMVIDSATRKIRADIVVVCGRRQPNYELASLLGIPVRFTRKGRTVSMLEGRLGARKVSIVGELAGSASVEECIEGGTACGREVAAGRCANQEIDVALDADEYLSRAIAGGTHDAYVCFCEDVKVEEVVKSIEDGYDSVESLKRFTGVLTGPCQGKQCALTVASIIALMRPDCTANHLFTTVRQPVSSVEFSQLAPIEGQGAD